MICSGILEWTCIHNQRRTSGGASCESGAKNKEQDVGGNRKELENHPLEVDRKGGSSG
jgi:hypothetical protein